MTDDVASDSGLWGVENGYFDVRGQWHDAAADAVRKIVAVLARNGARPAEMPPPGPVEPAHQGDGRRGWIVSAQLYALRSRRNWGIGDFSDLAVLIGQAAEAGASGVGLNPLHALFRERPADASPYAPGSRLAINPLYIDVEAVPHAPAGLAEAFAERLAVLRASDLVDYEAVAALKWQALREAYAAFLDRAGESERRAFETFCAGREPWLMRYAAFEVLRAGFGPDWRAWPAQWRAPGDDPLRGFVRERAAEVDFHRYVQWIADCQLADCAALARDKGMPVGLYLDIAVGVDPAGADAWMTQDAMLDGLSVGAPPDEFNTAGQDWGLVAFDPHGLVRCGFAPFRELLRAAMRHSGAIRIDHVMGLMRLFVIPWGSGPRDGAYLRFPFETLLAIVAEESRRSGCIVVGEDLGTVPDGFRDTMHRWGLWSCVVMIFERERDGAFRAPQHYPANAIASFGTHDLPAFAGWMTGHDMRTRRAIGIDPGESDDDRERARAALRQAIGGSGFTDAMRHLAATPSRLVSVALEDVLGLPDQVNVPGTVRQHPNWRRRLPVVVEDLGRDPRLREVAKVFDQAGRGNISVG